MMTITVLNKAEKAQWLPRLFDLFYENMQSIAPGEATYEQEKAQWLSQVSPALDKAPRQILLCLDGQALAGYVQYYTNGKLLMIEEIQLAKAYQRTTLFCSLCRRLFQSLPTDIDIVEAYAEKRNHHSRQLMQKLGMVQIGEEGPFVHLQGKAEKMKYLFQ